MKYTKQMFTVAAIYKIGALRGFDREALTSLMVDRAKMHPSSAAVLAGHWLTTEPYRQFRKQLSEKGQVLSTRQFEVGA